MDLRNRRRVQLLLMAAIFVAPAAAALILGFLGWAPRAHSYGAPIEPARDLVGVPVTLANGAPFSWSNGDAVWTLVALPGPDCATRCLNELDLVHRAQITLGEHAGKLQLLYLGAAPESAVAKGFGKVWMIASTPSDALDGMRAQAGDSVSAVLVTPTGKAFLRYPANFNAEALRGDLAKVVH